VVSLKWAYQMAFSLGASLSAERGWRVIFNKGAAVRNS
jgi:hypothetical protein